VKPAPLKNVLDLLLDAICVVDTQDRLVFVSAAFERIFGYRPEEVVGTRMIDLVFPEDRAKTMDVVARVMHNQPQPHFENRYVRKDGRVIHLMWSVRWSEADQVRIAVARDITELKHAESMQSALHAIADAAHSTTDLPALFERIHAIIGELLPARNFFIALYDAKRDELSFPYFVDAYDKQPAPYKLDSGTFTAAVVRSGQPLSFRLGARTLPRSGGRRTGHAAVDWIGVPLTTPSGTIGAMVVQSHTNEVRYGEQDKMLLQFVSAQVAMAIERKQADVRLQYIVRHDRLTDLANRELFHSQLEAALGAIDGDTTQLAALYIDLDKFKQVNDNYGHDVGDLLLQKVADRITHCVRATDLAARIGGDEFAVLLDRLTQPEHALTVAESIRTALNRPFMLAGKRVQISTSIGIALYPQHGDEYRLLMRCADDAMYRAKRPGGNRVRVATAPVHAALAARPGWRTTAHETTPSSSRDHTTNITP
jgi:diguanylate cyclase (GGDEF)-like protein/PAS domain S-box-containing protein